ncbi:spore germination protein [Bacillus sp. HMF5848]|uniref:spore germination protein n=1 Tax=Bacillus sp. HMF5848 TaxID=2495421 RepID=UPI000F790F34|nr:spore germination protein [Bacillus sp. HMF5848]RSK26365.1 spore germination protein [Bacillus sp. HMF5848]
MPGFVGAIKLNNVGSSSVFHIGDVYKIAPISNVKTFAGAGSFNTGNGMVVYNETSSTNVYDSDLIDQPIVGNA